MSFQNRQLTTRERERDLKNISSGRRRRSAWQNKHHIRLKLTITQPRILKMIWRKKNISVESLSPSRIWITFNRCISDNNNRIIKLKCLNTGKIEYHKSKLLIILSVIQWIYVIFFFEMIETMKKIILIFRWNFILFKRVLIKYKGRFFSKYRCKTLNPLQTKWNSIITSKLNNVPF